MPVSPSDIEEAIEKSEISSVDIEGDIKGSEYAEWEISEIPSSEESQGEEDSVGMDAVERFERMVDIQIDAISEVDSKAEHLTRLIGVFLGVLLTGLSVVARFENLSLEIFNGSVLIMIILGTVGLMASLFLAIYTYLSSAFSYGPSPETADYIADRDLAESEYAPLFIRGYADAIEKNERVLIANYRRFRDTLLALSISLLFLAVAALLVIASPSSRVSQGAAVATALVAGMIAVYLRSEDYLILNYNENHDE